MCVDGYRVLQNCRENEASRRGDPNIRTPTTPSNLSSGSESRTGGKASEELNVSELHLLELLNMGFVHRQGVATSQAECLYWSRFHRTT